MAKSKYPLRAVLARATDKCEPVIQLLIRISGWSAILFVAAIFFFIFREAGPILGRVNWGEFFFANDWVPNPAEGNEPTYGVLAMIYETFAVTVVSMLIAVPLGLGAAVYISEFATGKLKETLKVVIELLAAIPSII